MHKILFATVAAMLVAGPALAEGNLGSRPTALPDLTIGTGENGLGVSQANYDMETGKSYSLKIISTGAKECAWVVDNGFFDKIWLRKVEAGGLEIKATSLFELEYETAAESAIFFVPIVPGTFNWACEGLAGDGLTGTFTVK